MSLKLSRLFFIILFLVVLTSCTKKVDDEQTFEEYLSEHNYECDIDKCLYYGDVENIDEDSFSATAFVNMSYSIHLDKFEIDYVYVTTGNDNSLLSQSVSITIFRSNGNIEVISSNAYFSGTSTYWYDREPTATTNLYNGGWSCTGSTEDMKYCNELKQLVDIWIDRYASLNSSYESKE